MNTPFTDASTVVVHVGGKALPVTPASVAQLLERRTAQLEFSQDVAWGIIKLADWKHQSLQWQVAAREWQTDIYLHKELPLNYTPGYKPAEEEENPKTYPEALKLIAQLRAEKHEHETRFRQLEIMLEEVEKTVEALENENAHTRANLQQN